MAAVTYNFPIEQGSDFEISFVYLAANGTPIDLTDKCVVFQFSSSETTVGQCSKYVLSSQANSIYDVNGWSLSANNVGIINIKISAELTQNFNFTNAIYDLDIISQTGNLRNIRLSTGIITILKRNFSVFDACPINTDICTLVVTQTPTPTDSPTVTPTDGTTQTPTPTVTQFEDLCLPYDCVDIDIYSVVYNGSGLVIDDQSTVSGTITTTDTRVIENVELAINRLQHSSPQDLVGVLSPPSGDKILLFANQKIPNNNNNFSFMFSNKADPMAYLHNITNGGMCNIYDKTSLINYNSENLLSSFNHLAGSSVTGDWTLYIKDTDPLSSGLFDSWKLIITYEAVAEE